MRCHNFSPFGETREPLNIDWFQTKEELYDLRADPAENRNLAEDRSVTARYRALRDSLVGSIYRPPEMGRLQAALTGAARR